jgi:hypothetical protein
MAASKHEMLLSLKHFYELFFQGDKSPSIEKTFFSLYSSSIRQRSYFLKHDCLVILKSSNDTKETQKTEQQPDGHFEESHLSEPIERVGYVDGIAKYVSNVDA